MGASEKITIQTTVQAPVEKVWAYWTEPNHITKWNAASDDWHTPFAENDLRIGGKFLSRMEAKDGSFGFGFGGTYDEVKANEVIAYSMEDGRTVIITFKANGDKTEIVETFDADSENPVDMQRQGWQAILDRFKSYVEN
ncbi:SRPBCC domain-containing protein [Rossellomorea oryzaecorticis]|uniref:SRPBCC domain-containing protein n=1 Tax=Rossellomorea oryzaecorticis TaxID=1396505 RepID=A0ABW8VRY6_9BACI